MENATYLAGAHFALSKVTEFEEFNSWLEQNYRTGIEEHLTGYKILIRAAFQVLQDQLHDHRHTLNIESNLEYRRAYSEIADIDALKADSEASHLIKNLKKLDEEIHVAHNIDALADALSMLRERVIEPFDSLFSRIGNFSSNLSESDCENFTALFLLVTFANDTSRGYPEAFQIGWFDNHLSKKRFNKGFNGYKLALYWAYTESGIDPADRQTLKDNVLGAEDWQELDSSFQFARQELLEPFETKMEKRRRELFRVNKPESLDEISHLLCNAPDPAVGIEKSLNRFFLWDSVNQADDVIFGSGAAGFFTLLMGIQNIRQNLDTENPIQIRKLKHPVEPGCDYSYAIELTGWALGGTGTLHGWAIFVHMATDYSGFGGSQYELTENYLQSLLNKNVVHIQEMEISEDTLKKYLSEKGTRSDYTPPQERKPKYDNRRLTTIIRGREDSRTEFKQEPPSSGRDIAKEIGALANHKGGVLVFGVTDDGDLRGIDDVEELDNRVSGVLRNSLVPPLSADIHVDTIRGKDLLIVEVPNADKPVAVNYIYYGRNGTNVRKLTYQQLKEIYE